MAIVLTPVSPTVINSDDVRTFMRDFAQNNVLLDTVQFGHEEIQKAIGYVINEWNIIPPLSSDEEETIPKAVLVLGAAAWLSMSEAMLQIRNQATYEDGNVNIGVDDKYALYLQNSRALKEEWKNAAQEYKKARNMANGFGTLGSGYRYTNYIG